MRRPAVDGVEALCHKVSTGFVRGTAEAYIAGGTIMRRYLVMGLLSVGLSIPNMGCMGRLITEGVATATGASGKVVYVTRGMELAKYKGLTIESITVSPGLKTPPDITDLIRTQLIEAAGKKGLTGDGKPMLKLSGEIIHYESGGVVDEAIGPLEEVIVRCKLSDATSSELLTEANLIGRSQATSSSGAKHLAEGEGKALGKWLKEHGLKGADEKEKE
jgi:hypothetical protein